MEKYTCVKTFETLGEIKPILYRKYCIYTSRLDGKLRAVSEFDMRSEPFFSLTPTTTIEVDSKYLGDYFVKIDDHRIAKIKKLRF